MTTFTLLTLSGSLRTASLNTAMLEMAARCAPANLLVCRYDRLGQLPLFNPDLEAEEPAAVRQLRTAIAQADAVLIASPEYAHGVSGVMKNALDWMVSNSVLVDKPVALWNASPRASLALAALHETLGVMSARLIESAALTLLIKPGAPGQAPVNPDPLAMQQALRALAQTLAAGAQAG